ncbi:hypothetical protein F5Y03DRAFT_17128 [Xylaria venustula]|nr:hypothetical protein F5Y03DRAFT_17128 [Xylaria venustula]
MGGLAFASGPNRIYTPRMRREVYRAVRDRCQKVLRELYVAVATPIEGPAKTTFGDIDLFVAWSRNDIFPSANTAPSGASPSTWNEAVYRALGAIGHKSENPHVASMAIPWPKDFPRPIPECTMSLIPESSTDKVRAGEKDGKDTAVSSDYPEKIGIQVDIHVCKTLDHLQWMLFRHAHGDLWNLLGSMIRRFGLTIDEVGLYLRIPEIEALDKRKAKVLLSTDPEEILQFLGMRFDDRQWEEPFASENDVYEYATTCRLFWVRPEDGATANDTDVDDDDVEAQTGGVDGVVADKRKLKSNDRRRMIYRPVFKKWIEEYLPSCRASGRFPSTPYTRDEVEKQAFAYFPGVQIIYATRLATWRIERQRQRLWKEVIKPAVPTDLKDEKRSCCASALKKIILNGDTSFDGIVAPPTLRHCNGSGDGLFNERAVRDWVVDMWPNVLETAWRINNERYAAKLERKGVIKRTGSGEEKPADGGHAFETETSQAEDKDKSK